MLPMVTLDPPLCPVDDHWWAAGDPPRALGPARFSLLAAGRPHQMAEL